MSLYDSVKLQKRRVSINSKPALSVPKSKAAGSSRSNKRKYPKRCGHFGPQLRKRQQSANKSTTDITDVDSDVAGQAKPGLANASSENLTTLPQLRVVLTDISKSVKQSATATSSKSAADRLAELRPDCSILLPAGKTTSQSVNDDPNSDGKDDCENEDIGRLVWARWQRQSYPALVVSGRRCHLRPARPGMRWLLWLAEGKVSELPVAGLQSIDNPQSLAAAMTSSAQRNSLLVRGVRRLRLELIERRDESFQKSDGATGSSSGSAIGQDLAQLATEDEAARKRRQPLLSDWATDCLVDIYKQHRKSLGAVAESEGLHLAVSDSDDDEAAGMAQPHSFSPSSSTYSSGSNRNSLSGLSSRPRLVSPDVTAIYEKVLDGSIALENVCLACGTVRVEQQLPLLMEHPVLRGSLCVDCLENYLTVCFSVGDDGWFMYCSVCGRPGNQAMCGSAECGRCFCRGCLTLLIGQDAWQRIISDNGWLCHLCQLLSERLIQPRSDWRQRLYYQTEPHSLHPPPPPELQRSAGCSQPLRVLSLFDGVASALLCLQSAGLSVEICFASEIDQDAIRVAACNHGNRVRQLGSVTELTEDRLRSLLPIDLLIGGSPCSQLSAANPNRQGLASESGLLFFEFHRILELLRRIGSPSADERQRRPLFWLFENVASMRQEDKTRISRFLGREPIRLDAVIFSAQRRARLFWGNLPGMLRSSGVASTLAADVVHCARPAAAAGPEPREAERQRHLASCIDPRSGRAARHATVGCVTTKRCSGRGPDGSLPVADADGLPDALWVTELERLFGFPAHYTDCGLTDLGRRKLIGRSWCLPLVAHLLRPLRHFFAVLPGPDAGDGE
ncbi:hypothetical protein BOX15_Mlig034009g1 [Macrostomum lignano]|uniref:DNA (cytosine-5-)-methyltransferase n=1 Tax=Macrostomum lignano TaxID=282301 RepID=A0A267GI76_9PLAT|nr:hypothetical protein BOX15_Mlig034009g1 [Macrostomum lignano]